MEILEQSQGAVSVVKCKGALSHEDVDSFRQQVNQIMEHRMGRFVLDAAEIAVVDSKGLEVLAELADNLAQSGQTLKLCAANEMLREVLDLTDLSAMCEYYEDVNTAVRSFL